MFHPYWAKAGPGDTIPRDMAYGEHQDKRNLRTLYHAFLQNYYGKTTDGEYVYQIPAPRTRAAIENAETAEKDAEADASGEKPTAKQPKKPRKPRGPRAPRAPNPEKKRKKAFTVPSILTSPPNLRRLAREDDGGSLKNESRSTSVIDLETPALRTSPGSTSANPISVIDFEDLRRRMDRQANAVDLTDGDDSAQAQADTPLINLLDDYMDADPEEEERLLASWSARRGLAAQGDSVQNEVAATESSDDNAVQPNGNIQPSDDFQPSDDIPPNDETQLTTHEIQTSIDPDTVDLQDAQIHTPVSSKSASIAVDSDLEMIDPTDTTGAIIKVDDEDVVMTDPSNNGSTLDDAILLD